jgi:hypothetical protein
MADEKIVGNCTRVVGEIAFAIRSKRTKRACRLCIGEE